MSDIAQRLRIDAAAGLVPDIVRADCAEAADRIARMEAALRQIADGTTDEQPPFRAINHILMAEIARKALRSSVETTVEQATQEFDSDTGPLSSNRGEK